MGTSDYLADAMINFFWRNDADTFTPAATLYTSLFNAAGTELTSRTAVAFAAPVGTDSSSATADVTFTATSSGEATEVRIYDASSGGNEYRRETLRRPQTLVSGQTMTIDAAHFNIREK